MPRPAPGLKRIVRTAERLFARYGYDGVSVADVARVAGVSKAAVFHHFPRKIDLYRTIFSSAAADFRERMAPALDFGNGVREGVQSFLRARAKTHRERGSALRLVMREMAEGSPRLRGALRQSDVAENYRVVEHALVEAQRRGLDAFLRDAAIPAWNRTGIEPVGVFHPVEDPGPVTVLLRHRTPESVLASTQQLQDDQEFLRAGADFLDAPADRPYCEARSISGR